MDFFRITLTTPASASPPYTADEPTGTTSIRSIADIGMRFRLKKLAGEVPTASTRRPLISTSVEPSGMPRSCTVPCPSVDPKPPSPADADTSLSPARNRCRVGCPLCSMSLRV